jgi:hypothetical protein
VSTWVGGVWVGEMRGDRLVWEGKERNGWARAYDCSVVYKPRRLHGQEKTAVTFEYFLLSSLACSI